VLHRIRHEKSAQRFGQALFDRMFADMDRGLREMGTGDLSVGKQVKQMATGFFGRIAAYQAGIEGDGDLAEALRRNLFGTVPTVTPEALEWFVDYVAGEAVALARADLGEIVKGRIAFAALPEPQHG
jgi:cytochrome b pre-mRNA-processing protein 3